MKVDLGRFDNGGYDPGRGVAVRFTWYVVNECFFRSAIPWPYGLKRSLLRVFGAAIGRTVVIKPRVSIKYPWRIRVGDNSWIGEGVWIDSLAEVRIGSNACLSQGVMIETGNHDWSRSTFDLITKEVVIEDGAWAAVRCLLLPGARLASHSVLGAGSVLSGDTEAHGIYVGVPAVRVKERVIRAEARPA